MDLGLNRSSHLFIASLETPEVVLLLESSAVNGCCPPSTNNFGASHDIVGRPALGVAFCVLLPVLIALGRMGCAFASAHASNWGGYTWGGCSIG